MSKTFNTTEVHAYVVAIGAVPQVVSEYSRMIMNSAMYHSEAYTRSGKMDNTVVKINASDDTSEMKEIFLNFQTFYYNACITIKAALLSLSHELRLCIKCVYIYLFSLFNERNYFKFQKHINRMAASSHFIFPS